MENQNREMAVPRASSVRLLLLAAVGLLVVALLAWATANALRAQDTTPVPAAEPTAMPAAEPTSMPAAEPTSLPAAEPTSMPAAEPTSVPAAEPTSVPAAEPAGAELPAGPSVTLVKIADGLADPVNVAAPPDGSGRVFVVERPGRIRIIQDDVLLEEPFLVLTQTVKTDFLEQGLLGLAFHPDYANNGRFFVYYIDYLTNGDSYLVEYHVSDDPNVADPESARVILTQDQPFVNHNGGTIAFGPDGYLYLGLGDGGLAGDPYRNAQNRAVLLGKILRLDVDSGAAYAIPTDNPFTAGVITGSGLFAVAGAGNYSPGARPEIWAYGLRNPWQWSFDSATGDMFIADVGQNNWEEVNVAPAGAGGLNFGWPLMEGTHCYGDNATACTTFGVQPVAEYNHDDGSCSITGVGVYRGAVSTNLDGIYFYGDYCSGKIWGLAQDGDAWAASELLDTSLQISGAGHDEAGELYVTSCACDFARGYNPMETLGGAVWRLVASDQAPADAETAPLEEAAPASDAAPADAAASDSGGAQVVAVSLVDGHIDMPAELAAGPTVFEVSNDGSFRHTITIDGQGINVSLEPDLQPGESGTLEVDLAPGEYTVICPVGNHAERGMKMTLVVQ